MRTHFIQLPDGAIAVFERVPGFCYAYNWSIGAWEPRLRQHSPFRVPSFFVELDFLADNPFASKREIWRSARRHLGRVLAPINGREGIFTIIHKYSLVGFIWSANPIRRTRGTMPLRSYSMRPPSWWQAV